MLGKRLADDACGYSYTGVIYTCNYVVAKVVPVRSLTGR